jgi:hypothetical protein
MEHGVRVEFLTLREVQQRGYIAPGPAGRNCLHLRPAVTISGAAQEAEWTVSVAYYRAGYTPNDYPSEAEWAARRMIELSNAVKCPNAGYQLAGTKAVQASLCLPGVLERFLTAEEAEQLRACFADQYSLVALTGEVTPCHVQFCGTPTNPCEYLTTVVGIGPYPAQTRRPGEPPTVLPPSPRCSKPSQMVLRGCSNHSAREAATTCTAPS